MVLEDEHVRVQNLYTPLMEAVEELKRRKQDTKLQSDIAAFCEGYPHLPELEIAPRFVMARALFTPNLELLYFMDIVKDLPFDHILYEFTHDKFVSLNPGKKALARMTFYEHKEGAHHVSGSLAVANASQSEGMRLKHMRTFSGKPLTDFHHDLIRNSLNLENLPIVDFSDWFLGSHSFRTELPYLRYLSSFITHGILFENFLLDKYEYTFTMKRVLPAFDEIVRIFGIKPLIVPVTPPETNEGHVWSQYPEVFRSLVI